MLFGVLDGKAEEHQLHGGGDQAVQCLVDDLEGFSAGTLPGHKPPQKCNLPVWDKRCAAILRLSKCGIDRLCAAPTQPGQDGSATRVCAAILCLCAHAR